MPALEESHVLISVQKKVIKNKIIAAGNNVCINKHNRYILNNKYYCNTIMS